MALELIAFRGEKNNVLILSRSLLSLEVRKNQHKKATYRVQQKSNNTPPPPKKKKKKKKKKVALFAQIKKVGRQKHINLQYIVVVLNALIF